MNIYFAPLEGVTDAPYRRVHRRHFGGVTKYFIPFISPTQNLVMTNKELRAISPEVNAGVPVAAQVLTHNAEHFVWAAGVLCDMGYNEVNLNMGCPSGTVTAKRKGSGLLRFPDELPDFLDFIFEKSPLPVSIKTRIGYESPNEWPKVLGMLRNYPIKELAVHPRTRSQFYSGTPYRECFESALADSPFPVCYNGDLFSASDCQNIMKKYPQMSGVMLGRGLIANPALAQTLCGGECLTTETMRAFLFDLREEYLQVYPKNVVVVRMRESVKRMFCCFDAPEKALKLIRKATTLEAMDSAVQMLLDSPLRENPQYAPELG